MLAKSRVFVMISHYDCMHSINRLKLFQQEEMESLKSTVEILRKEMKTLADTVQRQNKEIDALKREGPTMNCNTCGNDNTNDNGVFNNTTFQGKLVS